MTKQSHCLDGLLGKQMVSTLPIPERRKSKDELAAMSIEDRLIYAMHHPMSEEEKIEELEREDRDRHYDMTGEVDERDLLDNHPPPDWGA
jgi:hypothetical protein